MWDTGFSQKIVVWSVYFHLQEFCWKTMYSYSNLKNFNLFWGFVKNVSFYYKYYIFLKIRVISFSNSNRSKMAKNQAGVLASSGRMKILTFYELLCVTHSGPFRSLVPTRADSWFCWLCVLISYNQYFCKTWVRQKAYVYFEMLAFYANYSSSSK